MLLRTLIAPKNKTAIIRICYGKLGQVLSIKIKISSGDPSFDARAIEYIQQQTHQSLHHPGKNKKGALINGTTFDIMSNSMLSAVLTN